MVFTKNSIHHKSNSNKCNTNNNNKLMRSKCNSLLLLMLLLVGGMTEGQAAVWIDDGYGHTVKEPISARESREFSHSLRLTMGLPDHGPHHGPRHRNVEASAQTFMKTIYNTLDEFGIPRGSNLDPAHREALEKADTVVSFTTKAPPERGEDSAHSHQHSSPHRILYFDTSEVSLDQTLLGAELRLHHEFRAPQYLDQHLKETLPESLTLHVYLITDAEGGEMEVAQTPLTNEGWLSLNVTAPALAWLLQPRDNRGFRLAVTADGHKHEQNLHSVGLATAHDREDHRPILVCFFSLPEGATSRPTIGTDVAFQGLISRDTPNTFLSRPVRSLPMTNRNNGYSSGSETSCQMRPLHVSFFDIGWDGWVIAPDGYDANFCSGHCKFPMTALMNFTNHAIVQTLINTLGADVVKEGDRLPPAACCAPNSLATISVLYYDYNNNVVLKKFHKMIVKNCACR